MTSDKAKTDFQRAATAPALPTHTVSFILYCLRRFRAMIVLMLLLETGQAAGSILVPYAVKALMDAVAQVQPSPEMLWEAVKQPLMLLAGLNVAEILFSRGSGAILIIIGPRLRQRTTRLLYAYLQQHSPRFFGNHFAGSLAHRISETAVSVNHTTCVVRLLADRCYLLRFDCIVVERAYWPRWFRRRLGVFVCGNIVLVGNPLPTVCTKLRGDSQPGQWQDRRCGNQYVKR